SGDSVQAGCQTGVRDCVGGNRLPGRTTEQKAGRPQQIPSTAGSDGEKRKQRRWHSRRRGSGDELLSSSADAGFPCTRPDFALLIRASCCARLPWASLGLRLRRTYALEKIGLDIG